MLNIDWFDESTKSEIQNLICNFCHNFFDEPLLLSCGDVYCKKCFEKNNNQCINYQKEEKCENASIAIENVPFFVNIIKEKIVKCKNKDCNEKIKLPEFIKHIEICPKELIKCQFNCGLKIQREKIKEHEAQCEYRNIVCDYCNEMFIYKDIEMHNSICSMKPIICALCKVEILRKDMMRHIDKECTESIRNCFYSELGCERKMKLKESYEHYINNKEEHIKKYSSFLIGINERIESMQSSFDSHIKEIDNKLDDEIDHIELQYRIIEEVMNPKKKQNHIAMVSYYNTHPEGNITKRKRGRPRKNLIT